MNKRIKYIIFTMIGIIIGSSVCVIGSNVITANQVGINSSKTDKTNIQDAIDELYTKVDKCPKNSMCRLGVKQIMYLDPTNLNATCNASNSTSNLEQKTGCMKWYVYAEDSTSYTMILDHNTTSRVSYNKSGDNSKMGTSSGEIGYELNQLTTTHEWKVTPRLITAQEIATIVGINSWNNTNILLYNFKNGNISNYAWLYDYTVNCHLNYCEYSQNTSENYTDGYWTGESVIDTNDRVWYVEHYGGFEHSASVTYSYLGLRPVITISK